jgi:hypothetical protein
MQISPKGGQTQMTVPTFTTMADMASKVANVPLSVGSETREARAENLSDDGVHEGRIDFTTASELVYRIFELRGMIGKDISTWSPQNFEDNPPRQLRLQMVDVLSDMFLSDVYQNESIAFKVNSILRGDFIACRKFEDYSGLIKDLDKLIAESEFKHTRKRDWNERHLRENYRRLIRFNILAWPLLKFNSGVIVASYPYYPFIILTEDAIGNIDLSKINELICRIIDPWDRGFSKAKLVEMGYPSENISIVDDDWL